MTTDPERLLADSLHARADHAAYERTPIADVVSTAHGIRRRRHRDAGLAAAALVVAVTVPAAVVLAPGDGTDPGPSHRTTSATPGPSPSGRALAELPQGPAPRIAYVDGHDFVSSEGSRTRLPIDAGISAATPYHGGFLVADDAMFEGTVGLHLIGSDGTEQQSWCSAGTPVVGADQMLTSWVTYDCSEGEPVSGVLHRGISTGMGEGETTQPVDRSVQLVGQVGDRLVLTSMFGDGGAWITDLQQEPHPIPGLTGVTSVDQARGLVGGRVGRGDGAIVDPATGAVQARLPGWVPLSFSPDGRYVVAVGAAGRSGRIGLLDASSGREVRRLLPELAGDAVLGLAWEDATHVVASVAETDTDRVALVRTDLDGTVERATPVLRARNLVLAVHP
jgi:hypothetical protein